MNAPKSWFRRFLPFLLLLGFLGLLAALFFPAGNSMTRLQVAQYDSDQKLTIIANQVLAYRKEHDGHWPEKLSQTLRPDLSYFVDGFQIFRPTRNTDEVTDPSLVDRLTDYRIGSGQPPAVVAYEKPDLWPDHSIAVCFEGISTGNSPTTLRLTWRQFAALGLR